jgi:gamma-glutamyl:cysteine ligase YbdK (ATP-grasp superfamily)
MTTAAPAGGDGDAESVRRSVEVEYWVVDESGRLTGPGELVDAAPGVEREFVEPLLEVKTDPCESGAELRDQLLGRLGSVLRRADELGLGLVPLATPLAGEAVTERRSERTRIQNRVVGDPFRYVRHCAGTHVHVEQQPGRVAAQHNLFVALDPALALLNSSSYFRGERVAAGARSRLYRRLAYADLPHQGRLWRYVDGRAEWSRRLERRYEEFVTRALDAGVDRAAVASAFTPESGVWTPVKLRDRFGTVEWRAPDTALPDQVLRVADRLAELTATVRDGDCRVGGPRGRASGTEVVLPEFGSVLDHVDAAIEDGLADDGVRAYLDRMGFDVEAYDPVTHELDGQGPVAPAAARELRLEYADRLDRAVRRAGVPDAG